MEFKPMKWDLRSKYIPIEKMHRVILTEITDEALKKLTEK